VGQGVFVYYEVYNLKRDAFGQTRYKVAYTIRRLEGSGGVIARLAQSFAGGKEEVAVGYEQVGLAASEPVHVELDLGEQSRPGRYALTVTVTDLNGGGTVEREALFTVAE